MYGLVLVLVLLARLLVLVLVLLAWLLVLVKCY
jgi:hypothetical protein